MINKQYSSYASGLKIGDLIFYKVKKKSYLNHLSYNVEDCGDKGIVLNREFLFENYTQWGNRKFFLYDIMNLNGKVYKLKTQNMKILKRTGAK